MKKYSFSVIIHLLFIVSFSIATLLLLQKHLWFSVIISLIILIVFCIHLYNMQIKHISSMHRITENVRLREMELKERMMTEEIKHQYYENLLNKVDTAVLVTDIDGKVEWCNQTAKDLLGAKPKIPEVLLSLSTHETQIVRLEFNKTIQEMAVSSTLFSAQGKEQLLISLKNIHSVLEQNEMEAWQKLIRVLTHEIMNSITPIISLSETISERQAEIAESTKESKVMLQAIQVIHRRSKGLLSFVENYRKLTKLPAPVYSSVSIKELFTDLQKLFAEKKLNIEIPQPDIIIRADRTQMEQVLINLIKNAIEATDKKQLPVIEMSTVVNKQLHRINIIIKDNGEGILPEVIDKIFVPFFTTKSSGSGIGLSLCKQIINQHGGTIHASSDIEKGSTFTITLPSSH